MYEEFSEMLSYMYSTYIGLLHVKTSYSCQILMKLELYQQIFLKC